MQQNDNYFSSGGLGDSFIVYLKLQQLNQDVHWTHVESNQIVASLCKEIYGVHNNDFLCDSNYIESYLAGKWKDMIPVSSGIDDWCPLKGKTSIVLNDPFLKINEEKKEYDVCIQVSAGAKAERKWNFNPLDLKKILKAKGYNAILIGNDQRFKDDKDETNFVGKIHIRDSLANIRKSGIFIGLSGFLPFYALANKIKTIHYQIDKHHNERYIHPLWYPYIKNIELGSVQEVLRGLNEVSRM